MEPPSKSYLPLLEKELYLLFTYSALPASFYSRDWIKITVLSPKRTAPEAMNPSNDVKEPGKNWCVKSISIFWNGLLSGLQNLDINFFWSWKACIWVRVERVLSRNMRFMICFSVECKLLKAACLQSAFTKNSGSFVFAEGYQTPRYPPGTIYICWENKGLVSAAAKYYTDAFINVGRIFAACYSVLCTINSSGFCYKMLFLL